MLEAVKLVHLPSGAEVSANIVELNDSELLEVIKNNNFLFDWGLERGNDVYKIYPVSNPDEILGLLSLEQDELQQCVEIILIEVAPKHKGATKEIDLIAGSLIAFAVLKSFQYGYDGLVLLEPKYQLVSLYEEKYGFEDVNYAMILKGEKALSLLKKYFGDE